jgi:hypothetical protein
VHVHIHLFGGGEGGVEQHVALPGWHGHVVGKLSIS